jgi:hypothetical protein
VRHREPSHFNWSLQTGNNKKYILKQSDTDDLRRRCGKESETIQHITAACEQLAATGCVKIYERLAKIIHQKLTEAAELIDDKSPHYKYTPANVMENGNLQAVLGSQHTYEQNNIF